MIATELPEPGTPEYKSFWTPKHIYALLDPETGDVRYIGKSIRPAERLQNHMNDVSNCHRSHWLQSLKRKGMAPRMVILESMEGDWPWQEAERYWIRRGLAMGWPLTNSTSGGDGVPDLPPETRERMRRIWLGRKHRPETLEKLSASSKGRRKTEAMKQHMSQLMRGREVTWGAKLAEAVRKLSVDQVDAIQRRLSTGERVIDLSKEFNVHRTTISKIKKGAYFVK